MSEVNTPAVLERGLHLTSKPAQRLQGSVQPSFAGGSHVAADNFAMSRPMGQFELILELTLVYGEDLHSASCGPFILSVGPSDYTDTTNLVGAAMALAGQLRNMIQDKDLTIGNGKLYVENMTREDLVNMALFDANGVLTQTIFNEINKHRNVLNERAVFVSFDEHDPHQIAESVLPSHRQPRYIGQHDVGDQSPEGPITWGFGAAPSAGPEIREQYSSPTFRQPPVPKEPMVYGPPVKIGEYVIQDPNQLLEIVDYDGKTRLTTAGALAHYCRNHIDLESLQKVMIPAGTFPGQQKDLNGGHVYIGHPGWDRYTQDRAWKEVANLFPLPVEVKLAADWNRTLQFTGVENLPIQMLKSGSEPKYVVASGLPEYGNQRMALKDEGVWSVIDTVRFIPGVEKGTHFNAADTLDQPESEPSLETTSFGELKSAPVPEGQRTFESEGGTSREVKSDQKHPGQVAFETKVAAAYESECTWFQYCVEINGLSSWIRADAAHTAIEVMVHGDHAKIQAGFLPAIFQHDASSVQVRVGNDYVKVVGVGPDVSDQTDVDVPAWIDGMAKNYPFPNELFK